MKSYGQLWAKITSDAGLRKAWRRVRCGHAHAREVLVYESNLDANLMSLKRRLVEGTYVPGGYRQFKIKDPKPRIISCASVEDRVVHHALCAVIAPVLERSFVSVSFACRKGYGAHAACALARRYAHRAPYFCKMDVRRYFDSIDHTRLLEVILRNFREPEVKVLITRIVCEPVPGRPRGMSLPIGNLTSQWFANAFLTAFDHAVLAGRIGSNRIGYLRYMDDFVFFGKTKEACWRFHDAAREWLREMRGLEVKDEVTVVAPVVEGVSFLGLRIWGGCWRLQRGRFLRTRRTFAKRQAQYQMGRIDEMRFAQCCASSDGASRWFGFKGILKDLASGEGSVSGSNRMNRGGSWNNDASNCTSSNRNNNAPSNTNNNIGFRLVSTLLGSRSHSDSPEFRVSGNEHAMVRRPVAKATVARTSFCDKERG